MLIMICVQVVGRGCVYGLYLELLMLFQQSVVLSGESVHLLLHDVCL